MNFEIVKIRFKQVLLRWCLVHVDEALEIFELLKICRFDILCSSQCGFHCRGHILLWKRIVFSCNSLFCGCLRIWHRLAICDNNFLYAHTFGSLSIVVFLFCDVEAQKKFCSALSSIYYIYPCCLDLTLAQVQRETVVFWFPFAVY